MYDEPYTYYPAPIVSQAFLRGLAAFGSVTLSNGESRPRFRIVWGMDRMMLFKGQKVPKYLGSPPRVVEVQEPTVGMLIGGKKKVIEAYGKPRWIVEEWHDQEMWSEGNMARAAREHERLRYRHFISGALDQHGQAVPVLATEDRLGPFQVDRWKYLCTLELDSGDYMHPDQQCLRIIGGMLKRRNDDRFVSVDAATKDLLDQMEAEDRKARDVKWDEAAELLKIHGHRLADGPGKFIPKGGGRHDRVILPGKPIEGE